MAARNTNGTFAKGQSGNSSGRPKNKGMSEFINDTDVKRCVTRLMGIVKNPKAKHSDVIKAAAYIIDQAKGKARQTIDNNHVIEDIDFPTIALPPLSTKLPAPDTDDDE